MKAAWYDRCGAAAEVLELGELPTPHAGPGEVRVRLFASAVNPADANRRAGRGHAMEFPRVIPDSDGAGVVDEIGSGVDRALLGQRVWLYNGQRGRAFGTAAEFIALDAGLVSVLPDSVSFEEAACLGIPGLTAWQCLFTDGTVAGQNVLVHGGAGAVGHFAVQLARWAGARVIATVSNAPKAAHARAGGAHEVIDYRTENVVARVLELTGGQGVDRIIEVDMGGNLATNLQLVRANAVIAGYATKGAPQGVVPFTELMRKNITLRSMMLPGMPLASRQAAQRGLNRWLGEGGARMAVSAVYALNDIVAAHEAVEAGTKLGTVIVRPAAHTPEP